MTSAVLILCTLMYAFFDKPDLLSRPFNFRKIAMVIILLSTAAFSGVKEYNGDIQQQKDSTTIDSLQGASNTLLAQIDTLKTENRRDRKSYIDSMVNYNVNITTLLAKYGLKVDLLNQTIEKVTDKVAKEIPPTLMVECDRDIAGKTGDKYINFHLSALNADVHIVSYYYAIMEPVLKGAQFEYDSVRIVEGSTLNYTSIIPKGETVTLQMFIDRANVADNSFIALECVYKSKGNSVQTPVRKIYTLYAKRAKIWEATTNEHQNFSVLMKRKGYWPVFYDL